MEVSPELLLSDVLSRSKRLEKLNSFRFNLSLPTVLNRTRTISLAHDDLRAGTLQLARAGVDLLQTRDILDCIKVPQVRADIYTPFQDRINRTYQGVIVKSIKNIQDSTEKMNEQFLLDCFKQKQSSTVQQSSESSVIPIFDPSLIEIGGNVKYELTPKLQFYVNLLPDFDDNMAFTIAKAIYNSPLKLFNNEMRRYFFDTFDLINHIKNNQTNSALSYLEWQKRRFIQSEVNSNLRSAERGGEFGIIPTIKGFLNLRKNLHKTSPWAILYYAIRCGAADAANEFAKTAEIDGDVKTAVEYYSTNTPITGHLLQTLMAYLNSEFNSPQYDKYKLLTLSILTKKRKIVIEESITIEDWLWIELQFNNNIEELADKLKSSHQFNQPQLQGQILLITGSYPEAAKWFLEQKEDTKDNLHVVLAMHAAGLINSDILLKPLINLSIDIFKANKEAAVRYLALIRDPANLIDALTEFVITADGGYRIFEIDQNDFDENQTKQDETQLVSSLTTERVSPIEAVLLPEIIEEVLARSSHEARHREMYDLAIKLFELSHNYEGIIEYDCTILKNMIENHVPTQKYNSIIQHHFSLILELSDQIDLQHQKIMFLLIKLANACEFERLDIFDRAANEFEEVDILPTTTQLAATKYEELMSINSEILLQVIHIVILSALRCYYNLYLEEVKAVKKSSMRSSQHLILKERCRALKEFAQHLDLGNSVQSQIMSVYRQIS